MSTLEANEGSGASFVLPPVLDLPAAAPLKSRLLEALEKGNSLVIDAGAVQRITTPCLQVLASVAKTGEAGGTSVRFHNVPEAFAEAARLLGLSQVLCIEEN